MRADESSRVRTLVRARVCACGCAHERASLRLRVCLCMHVRVRLQVRAGVHAGVRACAYIWIYDYYIIFLYMRRSVCVGCGFSGIMQVHLLPP